MRLLLCVLFGITAISSCGKERAIKIKAINAATGAPYAGLEYRVASSYTAANGEKYRTEASGVLDSNGEAMVNIRQRTGTYLIQVTANEKTETHKLIVL